MKPRVPQNFRRRAQAKRLRTMARRARARRAVDLISNKIAAKAPLRFAQSGDFDD